MRFHSIAAAQERYKVIPFLKRDRMGRSPITACKMHTKTVRFFRAAILRPCFENLERRSRQLVAEFDASFKDMHQRASSRLKDEVQAAPAAIHDEIHRDIQAAKLEASETVQRVRASHSQSVVPRWIAVGIVCAVALFVVGVMIGRIF